MRRTTKREIGSAAAALLAALAVASAVAPVAVATTTRRATSPASRTAKATARLYLRDLYWVQRSPVTVPGRAVKVAGVVWPYVARQSVIVRAYLGRRLITTVHRRLIRSRSGTFGYFSVFVSSPGVGDVTVRVLHPANSSLSAVSVSQRFAALDERVGFGSTGRFVQLLQQRLAALHFYIPQTGVYDEGTALALDAYHRLLTWGTSQTLDNSTVTWLLNGWGVFRVRYPQHGKHAEGNLSDQLLALINGSQVYRIYPISSGKPSTPTVLGNYRVYSKQPGYLPDGMYYSNFFTGGYAIHGYNPAPDHPASHGCMRVPIVDATSIYYWLNIGDRVDVYY